MRASDTAGFTILELSISIGIGVTLLVGMLGLNTESSRFMRHVDVNSVVRYEADRAFARVSEILRKAGWNSNGINTYPLVSVDRSEIQFRVLEDLDGNGYPFEQATGDLEWGALVYTVKRDPEGTLAVYLGGNPVWTLGRHIDEVEFVTFQEDNTVFLQEVRVRIKAARTTPEGYEVSHTVSSSVHMRN